MHNSNSLPNKPNIFKLINFNIMGMNNYFVSDDYGSAAQNPYFYLWIVFGFISSIYTYYWDVRMDWGLFETCCGENRFLREEIVYSSPVSIISLQFEILL